VYHSKAREFLACKPEVSNVLGLVELGRRMWLETFLRKVGATLQADEFFWFRRNMFEYDT
jgi:hypothetical protein